MQVSERSLVVRLSILIRLKSLDSYSLDVEEAAIFLLLRYR